MTVDELRKELERLPGNLHPEIEDRRKPEARVWGEPKEIDSVDLVGTRVLLVLR